MSDIIISGDNCALILNKEEALLIFALVGKLPCDAVSGAEDIFNTIDDSGFVSSAEYNEWWNNHEIKKRDIVKKAIVK